MEFWDFNSAELGCHGHSDPWRWN